MTASNAFRVSKRALGGADEHEIQRGKSKSMSALCSLSDAELVERLPGLVQVERHAMVDVIEHLVEMERRRLYLRSSSCLYRYCIDRLGYSADAALNRHRVAQLALRLPPVLDELRARTIHLSGLFLLSRHLTADNAAALLGEARGKSRRQIQELIARSFPRSDVPSSLKPVAPAPPGSHPSTWIETGEPAPGRLDPLSPSRLRVEFSARAELYDKVETARALLSHTLPSGDLGELFERSLDALIEQETRQRFGAGKPRKPRQLKPGSRHVPVEIARAVWQRDDSRCTFVDQEGHRCSERRFLTIEHRTPFALGGPPTPENLCLLCSAHNLENARLMFGERFVEAKVHGQKALRPATEPEAEPERRPVQVAAQVLSSLRGLGFGRSEASAAIGQVLGAESGLDVERLLRECLRLLVPKAS